MDTTQQRIPDFHVAVLAKGSDVLLVDLATGDAALGESMDALAQGYLCCGFFTVVRGTPSVQCEPGLVAALAMMHAGITVAEMMAAPVGSMN